MTAALLALALAAADAAPPPPDCLKAGETISGEMRWVETRHPGNKADLRFPFLVLDKARCVVTGADWSAGRWVQLGLSRQEMKGLVPGAALTVKANYMVPMGANHIGDILAMDAVVISQTPP